MFRVTIDDSFKVTNHSETIEKEEEVEGSSGGLVRDDDGESSSIVNSSV
jgi:hypothetical protein